MKRTTPTWFWTATTAAATALVLCLCVLHEPLWLRLGVHHLKPYFADLYAILAASDAQGAGADPFAVPNDYDSMGRPHVYGPLWLYAWQLGLTRADNGWLGIALGIASIASVAAWLRPRGPGQALLATAVMCSPAFLLSVERGNNDLAVLLLLLAAAALLASASAHVRRGAAAGAAALVGVAAALKFYPLLALPMLLERGRAGRALGLGTIVAAGFGLMWWFWRVEIAKAVAMVPDIASSHGFGLPVLGFLWGNPVASRGFVVVGVVLGAGVWIWLMAREWRRPIPLGWRAAGFVGGAAAWVFCYLVGFNYGYRGVLLFLPAGAWLHAMFAAPKSTRGGAALALSALLTMLWLVVSHPLMKGNLSLAELRVASFFLGLQNGLALGITGYLGLVLARRSWRALRRWPRERVAARQT